MKRKSSSGACSFRFKRLRKSQRVEWFFFWIFIKICKIKNELRGRMGRNGLKSTEYYFLTISFCFLGKKKGKSYLANVKKGIYPIKAKVKQNTICLCKHIGCSKSKGLERVLAWASSHLLSPNHRARMFYSLIQVNRANIE